jgi:hypothetical protein
MTRVRQNKSEKKFITAMRPPIKDSNQPPKGASLMTNTSELSVYNPKALLDGISHAGAIIIEKYTCEVLGDYCAGPNHVLPTYGTARPPLGCL